MSDAPKKPGTDGNFERQLRDLNDALLVSAVHQHELTERARADEQAASRLAETFATLVEQSPFGTYIVDAQFRVAQMSATARATFRNVDPLIGRNFAEVVRIIWPEPFATEAINIFRHTLDTGEPYVSPGLTEQRRDVEATESYEWQARRITLADGTHGVVCYFFDATRLRQAEIDVRRSEMRYRRLFEAAHDGILLLDVKTRRITDVNPFMLELLRYPHEYFIGKELWEIGLFGDRSQSQAAMQELHEKGSLRYENKPLLDRNGRRHDVEVVANIYQEDHQPVIQCNIRDVSERKRFEDEREAHLHNEQLLRMEAETANRAKDMFLATLSHEMRTPLNAIVGWMSVLRGGEPDAAELAEGLEVIDRNTRAQVQLIEDVLDVSRIVSGKLRLEIRPCELMDVINAGVDAVRPAAAARQITIDVQLDPVASPANCDTNRIQQVVWNLVSNAVKFTPKGGTISVALMRQRSNVVIRVTDSGRGISADLLPHVFDRFRQADSSTRRKFGGLGLGLSIVRHLVEGHGGTVEAESPGEGRGATFTVTLPVRAVRIDEDPDSSPGAEGAADPDRAASDESLVRLDGLRIVVVDDDLDARRLLARVLTALGAIVTTAGGVSEALDAIDKVRPEILVSDLAMPDADGFDLIRRVRAGGHSARDLPAVALTAFVHKEDQRQALLAGFQVHLGKPVDPHDLTTLIASLAGRTGPGPQ